MKKILLTICAIYFFNVAFPQTVFIDPVKGDDNNTGIQNEPLRTLEEGVKRINQYSGDEPFVLKLEPGLYVLDKNLSIGYNKNFTQSNPLTIQASVLPDDPSWTTESMPILISTAQPENAGGDNCTYSLRIETNHATVKGIKFLSNPSIYTKHFCIYRVSDTLSSLKVSQCMFLGDKDMMPVQVAVMVNGHGVEVEHCLFSRCRWAAIFFYAEGWQSPIKNASMHHCIIKDCYLGAVWTSLVDSDFKFYNNVVSNCKYFWIKNYYNESIYSIDDCVISNVEIYNGEWQEGDKKVQGNYAFKEKNILHNEKVSFVEWDNNKPFVVEKRFLHVTKDSPGYNLGAGIFKADNSIVK